MVAGGPLAGATLEQLRTRDPVGLLGETPLFDGRFPLLIKYLDAHASLSVQVHPSEAVARESGGRIRVKHEAWYVLERQPGGCIYHGLEPGVSREDFRRAMLDGRIQGMLRRVPVEPGRCYYLPSGTPHALGAGVLVAEIQTPSDTTYRLWDWGRIDPATGRPRDLHPEQALRCIDFDSPPPPPEQPVRELLLSDLVGRRLTACPWFTIDEMTGSGPTRLAIAPASPPGIRVWLLLEGRLHMTAAGRPPLEYRPGDVLLLPAACPPFTACWPTGGRWLEVRVPAGNLRR